RCRAAQGVRQGSWCRRDRAPPSGRDARPRPARAPRDRARRPRPRPVPRDLGLRRGRGTRRLGTRTRARRGGAHADLRRVRRPAAGRARRRLPRPPARPHRTQRPLRVVIVWINGAFGAGKTQAAYELVRRTDRSVLCDPEIVGHGLNSMVPPAVRGDFQDLPAWRIGVRDQLAAVASAPEHDLVVVPMTLIRPAYREEILDHLAARGHDVRRVVLTARPATLRRRLRGRAAPLLGRGEAWALSRVDR